MTRWSVPEIAICVEEGVYGALNERTGMRVFMGGYCRCQGYNDDVLARTMCVMSPRTDSVQDVDFLDC